jgi:predicted DNA-binding protein
MAETSAGIIRDAIEAFVSGNTDLAHNVLEG